MWPLDVNDVMHWKRARGIWGDLKIVSELSSASEEEDWLSLDRRGVVTGVARGLGEMEKSV